MTLSTYIESLAILTNPAATFQYARNTEFNIIGDDVQSPVILAIEPDQGFLNLSNVTGTVGDGYNLFIRFLELIPQIGIAEQAPTRDAAIQRQKEQAAKFIYTLSSEDKFKELTSPIPYVRVIEAYDGNWFGVEINLRNLEFIEPLDIC